MRGKDRSTIRNKGIRNTVEANNILEEYVSEFGGVSRFYARNNMCSLRKAIDKGNDRIESLAIGSGGWQIGYHGIVFIV